MKFRARILKKPLKSRIEELEKAGKQTILIDDWFFKYLNIYKDLSFIILMERPFADRSNAVIKRDKVGKEEIVIGDLGHRTGNYRDFLKGAKVIRLNNNLGKAELKAKSEQLYKQCIHQEILKNKWKVQGIEVNPELIHNDVEQRKKVIGDEEYGK